MKKILTIALLIISMAAQSQQTIYDTIVHDGLQRAFILYVPEIYTPDSPAPLILNFHGYTSTAFEQMNYGDFRPVSDTAGFLLVHPMGTLDNAGNTYWNANWGGDVDDVGFTEALIDSLSTAYAIDQEKIYSTGMSNGGFMSYALACELSNRIAAIASVTGSMVVNSQNNCNPDPPVSVMEIHGTADLVVPYSGNFFMEGIPEVLDFWIAQNQCNTIPEVTEMPDLDPTDGCTVEYYLYSNGLNSATVEHFKVINGGHTWPGSIFSTGAGNTNQDINASTEIWKFFRKYDINGLITPTGQNMAPGHPFNISISPNPAKDMVRICWQEPEISTIQISDPAGNEVMLFPVAGMNEKWISVGHLEKALYFIGFKNQEGQIKSIKKILIQ
jgi:polyhydroxybutyrate depolymerase